MSKLSLTDAPVVLPVEARTRWLNDDHADLNVGDLWLLSWNLNALALVVVTKVIDDYVLGCPVTLPNEPSFAPAVVREETPLGVPLTVWPRAETGLGKHLLRRNLGRLLSETTVQLLRRYAEDGGEPPLPIAEGDYHAEGNSDYLRELLASMQALCFHQWPTDAVDNAVLSTQVVAREGTSISFMMETLGIGVPRARQLLLRSATPTESEVAALTKAWGLEPADILSAPADDAARVLIEPGFKSLLDQVMAEKGCDEVTARHLSQQEYTLAARTAQTGDRYARMRAAIDRVLKG